MAGDRAALVAGTTVLGALWLWRSWGSRGRRALAAVLTLLLVLDLGSAMIALKQQNRGTAYNREEALVHRALVVNGQFGASGVPPRVFLPTLRGNAGMRQGWSAPFGYASLNLGRAWNYIHDTVGIVAPLGYNTFPSLDLARSGPFPYPSMALVMGVDPRANKPVLNPAPDARAYLAHSVRVVHDAGEATALMRGGHESVLDSRGAGARKRGRLEPRQRPNLDGKATREDEPATLDLYAVPQ